MTHKRLTQDQLDVIKRDVAYNNTMHCNVDRGDLLEHVEALEDDKRAAVDLLNALRRELLMQQPDWQWSYEPLPWEQRDPEYPGRRLGWGNVNV